jgi:NADH-quinone oxidoreductase subunit L
MVMAHLGAGTALFAACIAVVQTDIKKVLAYSTCSQLGYMIAALGAGSMLGGFFHLTTHAFFKALLFLAAGSVIHAVGSNELSDMGGLSKKMKLTTVVFVIGAAALAGVPGFSGFFSKEMVLAAVEKQHLSLPLVALLAAAFLTAFYMGRVTMLAFFGKLSEKAAHAHEAPPTMAGPLVLLAVPALVAGFGAPAFATLVGEHHSFHVDTVGVIASGLALGGLGLAWYTYKDGVQGEKMFAALAPIGRLARSGLMDRIYVVGYRRVLLVGAAALGWIDRYVIDGLMNLVGWAVVMGGRAVRRMQGGDVGDYVFAVVAGAILLAAWGIWR